MENFFPLNNDPILEDSSEFNYPMAQMFMPTTQTSSFVDMLRCSGEFQPSTASFLASQQLQMEANIHPTEVPLYNISSGENLHFVQQNTETMAVDQARFPLVSDEEILEINETAASKNTARATKTWMSAWTEWCKARNIDVNMESYCPQALDGLLNKFYVEIRKKDGTDYEPDSLRVMQAAIDRYLRHKNYPVSIITGREFIKSQETLDAKAKQLRRQGKGKRPNKAQPYSETDEEIFWREGKLGNHNGLALTNVNFKNLSETMGFRGRQDHYDAYVEDFSIFQMADGSKVVEFKENPTKTRQGGLRNPTRRSPQQMWSTDGGEQDPVKLFEEWLDHRPDVLKKSGPLYLTIIPRPTSNTWYSKTRMGQHRIGQIMKSVASCLPPESNKKITNHSTRKTVVAKLKNAGQPRHKIIQVTGHARESSLDDYDEITVSERRELSHIASGYVPAQSSSTSAISSTSASTSRFPSHSSLPEASANPSAACMKENLPPAVPMVPVSSNQVSPSVNMAEFTGMPSTMYSMATKQNLSAPFQIFNSCVFNTNNLRESPRPEKPRKRKIIIDSDSD